MKTLGIYYIATSNYCAGFSHFIKNIHLFAPELKKKIIILSDGLNDWDGKCINDIDCKVIHIDHYPWPIITLFKFYNILKYKEDFDYVMYVNAETQFNSHWSGKLWSVFSQDKLTLARHPQSDLSIEFDGSKFNCYPKENTSCYIKPSEQFTYVCAGLVFGPSKIFFNMCEDINSLLKTDLMGHIFPMWHDETYLNFWRLKNLDLTWISSVKLLTCGFYLDSPFGLINSFIKDRYEKGN